VCTGEAHTCALDATGAVWCWGGNQRGQLGSGTREPALQPELVTLPGPARSLSCDFNHGCALLSDGRLYCWGQNGEGELGQDDAFPGDAVEAADGLTPLPVAGSFRSVDTGQGHTCAIAAAGTLFCWGRNSFYELGSEPRGQVRSPLQVGTESDWERVDAGQNHSCGLRRDGSLWCWGRNTASDEDEGFPLGIEGPLIVATPTRVGDAANWSKLATSIFHTCAIDAGNALFCWGRNIEGQLGVGSLPVVRAPEAVADAVAAVATGGFFGCAIRLDGTVACAGESAQGQLGTGDNERRDRFSDLAPP
jgi:alpha-tubulin suppressor-like RCC1 family protein